VAVISHGYWQRRLGGSADAIGKKILIAGTPFTIIGVTPPKFFGLQVGDAPEISVPIMMQPRVMPDKENWLGRPRNTVDWLSLFGRLKPGVTTAQATNGLQALFRNTQTQLAAEIGLEKASWRKEWVEAKVVLLPGATGLSRLRRQYSGALYLLLGMVGLVLLIACANVANLLLARASARRREIALRLAIGASGARVVRQLLVESLILSGLGGALGIALSFWIAELLIRFLSVGGPLIRLDLSSDWRVLLFTAGISIATGILFGLAPALRGAGLDLATTLKQSGRGASAPQRFARVLSVAQVARSPWSCSSAQACWRERWIGSTTSMRDSGAIASIRFRCRPKVAIRRTGPTDRGSTACTSICWTASAPYPAWSPHHWPASRRPLGGTAVRFVSRTAGRWWLISIQFIRATSPLWDRRSFRAGTSRLRTLPKGLRKSSSSTRRFPGRHFRAKARWESESCARD
jgi:FtsX-like permease family/MacB-like periplasmic core domain